MKGDGNCGYYGIISQVYPDRFGGSLFGPGREIPLEAKSIVNNLRKIVFEYNNNQLNYCGVLSSDNYKIEENDWLQLNLIQPLADYFNQLIIVIDYASPLVYLTVPGFVDSILIDQDELASLTCREIVENRGYIFDDFQRVFQQNTKYLFCIISSYW
jgi:hypothetical protein